MVQATDATRTRTCSHCAHHFITYDPSFPYGCRAMNFKSKRPPHLEVEAASGLPCQAYLARLKTVKPASA